MKDHINLNVIAPPLPALKRWLWMAAHTASQMVVVGVGWVIGSPAMQWLGVLVWWAMLFAFAASHAVKRRGLTIAEARLELDKLERKP